MPRLGRAAAAPLLNGARKGATHAAHSRSSHQDTAVSGARRAILLATAVAALPLLMLALALAAAASGALDPPAQAALDTCFSPAPETATAAAQLSAAQTGNARIIYDVSVSLKLPQQAAVIAIATAMQESRLLNIDYGTADSLGLFQQRPSQGWGSPQQIMQPVYAATAFYEHLVQVPGWQSLPLTVAAQDVQHSAYPGAYAQWQQLAQTLVSQFSGQAADCAAGNGGGVPASGITRLPQGFTLPAGTPAAVVTAIAYAVAQLGKPYIWGGTGPAGYDCSGLVMMAYRAAGIDLPRTTFQQVYSGTPVYSLSQLEPGDLLFTAGSDGTPTDPGHVGMYIGTYRGQGLVLQAPETGEKIMVTPLAGYWAQQTVAIRRVA
jgi:cell wall-associated NlpC family hydrolase